MTVIVAGTSFLFNFDSVAISNIFPYNLKYTSIKKK